MVLLAVIALAGCASTRVAFGKPTRVEAQPAKAITASSTTHARPGMG